MMNDIKDKDIDEMSVKDALDLFFKIVKQNKDNYIGQREGQNDNWVCERQECDTIYSSGVKYCEVCGRPRF